jgi:hypothetical protein
VLTIKKNAVDYLEAYGQVGARKICPRFWHTFKGTKLARDLKRSLQEYSDKSTGINIGRDPDERWLAYGEKIILRVSGENSFTYVLSDLHGTATKP